MTEPGKMILDFDTEIITVHYEIKRKKTYCYQVLSPDSRFAQTKSIRPKLICHSLSLKREKKHGKTVTVHVQTKGN